jgi:SAM-dependent methyltransferase
MSSRELMKDIVKWDVMNWSNAISFWDEKIKSLPHERNCLELGGHEGGLSLWLAMKGNVVVCSDIELPEEKARALHNKYNCSEFISYEKIDATNLPKDRKFDIVIFKSIMGGVSANGEDHLKQKMIDEIYESLADDGVLLFAENLEASGLHKWFRKKFINWGNRWNYLKYNEIEKLLSKFKDVEFETVGFFGTFGRSEWQRKILSRIDVLVSFMIPKNKKYIVYGIAKK